MVWKRNTKARINLVGGSPWKEKTDVLEGQGADFSWTRSLNVCDENRTHVTRGSLGWESG